MSTEYAADKWAQPQEVDRVSVVFGGSNVRDLMPSYEEAEQGLAALPKGGRDWIEFQQTWFYDGIPKGSMSADPVEGVDPDRAFRHLAAIQGSWEPKHEHK